MYISTCISKYFRTEILSDLYQIRELQTIIDANAADLHSRRVLERTERLMMQAANDETQEWLETVEKERVGLMASETEFCLILFQGKLIYYFMLYLLSILFCNTWSAHTSFSPSYMLCQITISGIESRRNERGRGSIEEWKLEAHNRLLEVGTGSLIHVTEFPAPMDRSFCRSFTGVISRDRAYGRSSCKKLRNEKLLVSFCFTLCRIDE